MFVEFKGYIKLESFCNVVIFFYLFLYFDEGNNTNESELVYVVLRIEFNFKGMYYIDNLDLEN